MFIAQLRMHRRPQTSAVNSRIASIRREAKPQQAAQAFHGQYSCAERMALTKEVCLNLALSLGEGVCQHLALDGQVLYLEDFHQALDAVSTKHPEQAADTQKNSFKPFLTSTAYWTICSHSCLLRAGLPRLGCGKGSNNTSKGSFSP